MFSDNKSSRILYSYLYGACALIIVWLFTYRFAYSQMLTSYENDYNAHVNTLISIFRSGKWLEGWMSVPHCLWHLTVMGFFKLLNLPLTVSAAAASSVYAVLYYLVLIWFIKKISMAFNMNLSAFFINIISLGIFTAQSLHFSFLDAGERYLGPFSMNPIHNPTHMGVRVFAVLSLCLVIDLISYISAPNKNTVFFDIKKSPRKYYLLLSVVLLLSVMMKPTFAEMFIPAVGLYMLGLLVSRIIRKKEPLDFFENLLKLFLSALPAIIYILLQFIGFFSLGGGVYSEGGVVFTEFLEVWSSFSDNIVLSILFGMSLPIFMLIIDFRFYIQTHAGRLSIICYGIAFLEAAFLGEDGSRMEHANFMWPLMAAMLVAWLISIWHLLILSSLCSKEIILKETKASGSASVKRILVVIGWGLFFLHFIYGISFYILY